MASPPVVRITKRVLGYEDPAIPVVSTDDWARKVVNNPKQRVRPFFFVPSSVPF
jgi:hypothetical protein